MMTLTLQFHLFYQKCINDRAIKTIIQYEIEMCINENKSVVCNENI